MRRPEKAKLKQKLFLLKMVSRVKMTLNTSGGQRLNSGFGKI